MYEDNLTDLPPGEASVVFADILADMQRDARTDTAPAAPGAVFQQGHRRNLQRFGCIARRLLSPGSRIVGIEHLEALSRLAAAGESCLLCLLHRSNLDVPTLYSLLTDQARESVFHRIIWIAGRKLTEDSVATRVLIECFNRLIVTPRSWMKGDHTESELRDARLLNKASQRAMINLCHEGWIFGLFPSGTRIRPGDESTTWAIDETDTYIKSFQHMVLGHIQGCTLPVSHDWNLLREKPRLDQIVYTLGPVLNTIDWRQSALARYPECSQRDASARAIMEDINELAPSGE